MPTNSEREGMAAQKLFGTSGIRGLVGSEVTCELALNVGKSLAYYLGNEGTVVIGYDREQPIKCLTRQFAQDFWKAESM